MLHPFTRTPQATEYDDGAAQSPFVGSSAVCSGLGLPINALAEL